jgi:GT2 family glycosyltransferase
LSTERADVGVVIVSYNTRDLLDRCLTSLGSELRRVPLSADVRVVDNASQDGSADMVQARHPDVSVRQLPENIGFAAANNTVLDEWSEDELAAPEWVLILNPDTEVRPAAIATLVDVMSAEPTAAVAGPRLEYPDGRFQHGAFRFPGFAQTVLDLFPIDRLMDTSLNGRYPRSRYERRRPFAVDFPLGACMLVRGSALADVGPMDDGFFMYCEEIDWCRRFRDAGYDVLCVPEAVVAHHAGASTGQFRGAMLAQLWRSRLRYFQKHEPPARRALLRATVRCGLRLRRLADRIDTRRGLMGADERAERAAAYNAVFSPRLP